MENKLIRELWKQEKSLLSVLAANGGLGRMILISGRRRIFTQKIIKKLRK